MEQINAFDLEELMYFSAGLNEETVNDLISEGNDVCVFCEEQFGCTFEQFRAVANALIKLTVPVKTALTEDIIHAFATRDGGFHRIIARVKSEVKNG